MTRARNSANLASDGNLFVDIANDRTGIGSVVPAQNLHVAGTAGFHADVTFTGDNARSTFWDRSSGFLKFNDNAYIKMGTDSDMSIYHDGTNNIIAASVPKNLLLQSDDLQLQDCSNSHPYVKCVRDSYVRLYHDNSTRFQTAAYGVNVTGTTDTDGLIVSGVATVTTMNVTGVLTYDDVTSVDSVGIVTARQGVHIDDSITHIGDTDTRIRFPSNDAINLETGGTPRLSIDSSGNVTISGNLTVSGTTTQNNSVSTTEKTITLASGSANNAAVDGAGLVIDAGSDTDKTLKWLDSTDRWTFTGGDVAANSFHGDGSNLTGITQTAINSNADNRVITGSGTANTLNAESTLTYNASVLNVISTTQGLGLNLRNTSNEYTRIKFDAARTGASSALGILEGIWNNGNSVCQIYLQSGDDTTNKDDGRISMVVNSAAGSNKTAFRIEPDASVQLPNDSQKLQLGNDQDLNIWHGGSNGYIDNETGSLSIRTTSSNTVALRIDSNGKVLVGDGGSITPSRNLDVRGSGHQQILLGSTNNAGASLMVDGQGGGDGSGGLYCTFEAASNGHLKIINYDPNKNIIFGVGSNVGGNESVVINSNGGVGINTSSFSSSLNNEVGLAIHGESNDNCRIVLTTPTKSSPPSSIGYFGLNRFGVDTYDGLEIRDVTDSYATRLRIGSGGGIKINCNETYYAVNLSECNTGQLALNINKTRQGQTKGIAFGAIGSSTSHTGIQCYDTSNNSANPLLLNPFGGNIGIGYVSPRTALEVKDTHDTTANTLTPVLRLSTGNSYSGSNTGSALEFGTTNTNYPTWIKGRIGAVYNGSSNYGGHLVFQTNSGSDNVSSVSEKMRITDTGKVGMGVNNTSPNGALDIRTTDDDDAIRLVNTSTGNNGIQWWNEYGGLTKRVSMDYGEGDANFDIKLFRADAQDDRPYGNVRIFTGSYSSPNMNFRVTTLGTVHQPNQPAFLVRDSNSSSAFGANAYADFDTVILNRGNHYDTSNGRFTAPIAGTYLFISLMLSNGSSRLFHEIRKNGSQVVGTRTESGTNAGQYQSNTTQAILELAKGDWVAIHVGSGGAYGGSYSNFSGYLLG